jgi:hypothetical protein
MISRINPLSPSQEVTIDHSEVLQISNLFVWLVLICVRKSTSG